MRIAHVLPALDRGGGERVAIELAHHAALSGHDVTVYVGWKPSAPMQIYQELLERVKLEYIVPSGGGVFSRYTRSILWIWQNRNGLAAFDLVHCHLTFGAFVGTFVAVFRRLNRQRRPKLVETYHAVGMPVPIAVRYLHSMMAKHRDALVLMAEDEHWKKFKSRNSKLRIVTILNGASDPKVGSVTPEERLLYRRTVGIPDSARWVVGTLGHLRPDRQPWLFIPVFVELKRLLGPGIHFIFAGGGPESEGLHLLSQKEGIADHVHITGPVSEPRFALSAMDLYVTLNVGPVTGLAGMEAALSGLPVFAIQMLNSYDENSGDWIPSSTDPRLLASRIADLLLNGDGLSALGSRQTAYARQHCTVNAMATSYEALYQSLALATSTESTLR